MAFSGVSSPGCDPRKEKHHEKHHGHEVEERRDVAIKPRIVHERKQCATAAEGCKLQSHDLAAVLFTEEPLVGPQRGKDAKVAGLTDNDKCHTDQQRMHC
jgi:hypothetical protein